MLGAKDMIVNKSNLVLSQGAWSLQQKSEYMLFK